MAEDGRGVAVVDVRVGDNATCRSTRSRCAAFWVRLIRRV